MKDKDAHWKSGIKQQNVLSHGDLTSTVPPHRKDTSILVSRSFPDGQGWVMKRETEHNIPAEQQMWHRLIHTKLLVVSM